MSSVWLAKARLPLLLLIFEIVFIVLFAITADYEDSARPKLPVPEHEGNDSETGVSKVTGKGHAEAEGHGDAPAAGPGPVATYYPMFQDVHVMMFIGFGFLMTFLRRYGYSSVGVNMLLAAVAIQWALLVGGYLHGHGGKVHIGITNMLTADFASASVLITFGALLGKTSPLQLVIICFLEIILFSVNEWIGLTMLGAVDVGGSMFVHAFGAYFGLTVSRVLHRKDVKESTKEGPVYHSDVFAMIGTIFLWLFWPSFNSALAVEDAQHRAVINTYLALAACCVVTFAVSALTDPHCKFDMVHVQNATLAGGVAVGTSADMMIGLHGAVIIGSVAGALSVIGYKYITPFLASRLKIHDTCGVNNLHGMPAILAAFAGCIASLMADETNYGYTLYRQFPARAPTNETSPEFLRVNHHMDISAGKGRTAAEQASFQIAALGVTLVVAITGGLIVGLLVRFIPLDQPRGQSLFEDTRHWHVPDGEDSVQEAKSGALLTPRSGKQDLETGFNGQ